MHELIITPAVLIRFRRRLIEAEKSEATIGKYLRDAEHCSRFLAGRPADRARLLAWKALLLRDYAPASVNSMLASVNALLRLMERGDLCLRQVRVQHQAFAQEARELTRAEYQQLVQAAQSRGKRRLSCLIQAICATGMRVSEVQHLTVESLHRGEAIVSCKGKTRRIFLVAPLRKLLLGYARSCGITAGPVFRTRTGRPMSRTAIWREMKSLCRAARVAPEKVFPHNLRHLFARIFYAMEKDIAKLADILGHSSINTTRIYIATTGREHRQRMERMHLIIQAQKNAGHPRAPASGT